MTAAADLPPGDHAVEVWQETLDSLERAVREAARLARHPHTAGRAVAHVDRVPPAPLERMPAELGDRARELLRAIDAVEADLSRAMETNLAELAGLARSASGPRSTAAYIDFSA